MPMNGNADDSQPAGILNSVWDQANSRFRVSAATNVADATSLASAARTTTQTLADISTNGKSFLNVVLDLTVNTGGLGSVTLTINGKDPASGKYYLILAGAAVTTVSTNRYKVGPTITAAANAIAQDYLPATIQLVVTANNANTTTYSLGYSLTA